MRQRVELWTLPSCTNELMTPRETESSSGLIMTHKVRRIIGFMNGTLSACTEKRTTASGVDLALWEFLSQSRVSFRLPHQQVPRP